MRRASSVCSNWDEAVKESIKLLKEQGASRAFQNHSLCLPQSGGKKRLVRMRGLVGGKFVLGSLSVAVSGFAYELDLIHSGFFEWVFLALGVVGITLIFLSLGHLRRMARAHLDEEFLSLSKKNQQEPGYIGVELAATFEKLKILPDDVGHYVLDAQEHRLVLEGVVYLYSIRAEDVVNYSLVEVMEGQVNGVGLDVRVGSVMLELVLTQQQSWRSILKTLWNRKTLESKYPLFDVLHQWLESWREEVQKDNVESASSDD